MKHLARRVSAFREGGAQCRSSDSGTSPFSIGFVELDDVSFLRRARRHSLGRISDADIRDAMRMTIEQGGRRIAPRALDAAVQAVDGFPYMMQLVGFRVWAENPRSEEIAEIDVERGVRLARKEMVEGIVEYTYREFRRGTGVFCSLCCPTRRGSFLSDVAKRMGVKSNYASQYKRRLLEQGVIGEPQAGFVRFDMPMLREYLFEQDSETKW